MRLVLATLTLCIAAALGAVDASAFLARKDIPGLRAAAAAAVLSAESAGGALGSALAELDLARGQFGDVVRGIAKLDPKAATGWRLRLAERPPLGTRLRITARGQGWYGGSGTIELRKAE